MKNDAMNKFKDAINNARKKDEEKEEENQEKKESRKLNPIEPKMPSAHSQAEAQDEYSIYDEDEEETENNSNDSNSRNDYSDDDDDNEDDDNKDNDNNDSSDNDNNNDDKSKNKDSKSKNNDLDNNNNKYKPNNNQAVDNANNLAEGAENAQAATEAAKTAKTSGALGAKLGAIKTKLAALKIPLAKFIIIAVIVVLILLLLIGFVSFFINGPGLVRDKILKFADGIWTNVKGLFVGLDQAQVKEENIIEIADYLEEMGYDLANYGFLDTNGKNVTIEKGENGEETIKNSKGKVILKREISKDTGELEITKIQSKYIMAYLAAENDAYMITNQNFNLKDYFKNIFLNALGAEEVSSEKWGTGLITVDGDAKGIEIDREKKQMKIKYNDHVYQYSLDGWTGRYGKSIEFLLTLHIATMAPDFVYDFAKLDTKVFIALYPTTADIELVYKTEDGEWVKLRGDNYSQFGITSSQWQSILAYGGVDIPVKTPFITKVVNHWYKDLDFTNCYEEVENDPNTTDDDEKFTYYYPYVGLGEEDDELAGIENLYVREVRKKDIYQCKEPAVKKTNNMKKMLLGTTQEENSENTNPDYKYYIYNGTGMSEEQEEREKKYIIQKIKIGENEDEVEYVMNTRMFTEAFAILEAVHSEDAEFILRDLKELFSDIGVEGVGLEDSGSGLEDDGEEVIEPLTWPIEDYKPIVWDPVMDAEDVKVMIKHETQSTIGFSKGKNVIMPANGKIVQITRGGENEETGEIEGDSIKIEFTGDDREDLEGMCIYISGIKLDESITEGMALANAEKIGETIDKDITIVMTDAKRKAVTIVDKYIVPENWDELEEVDEISSDYEFWNGGMGEGIKSNDYIVNTAIGGNILTKEEILKGLEWYKSVNPQGYQNLVDNIDAFMRIQQQYGVNAVFGIAVAMFESGAGTDWDNIAPYTHNWMSQSGSYNGAAYTDKDGNVWKSYPSYADAVIDFGGLIAERGEYFTANKNTVVQIQQTYCPDDKGGINWRKNVIENMSKIFQGSGAKLVDGNASNSDIVNKAQELFKIVHDNNFIYDDSGQTIPINVSNRRIDCSSFVDWVLYELGYSDFGGGQKNTYWWYHADVSKYGWTSFYMNGQDISVLKPGDIIVLNGTSYNNVRGITQTRNHMQIFTGAKDSRYAYAYDCGGTSNWSVTTPTICDSTLWAYQDARVIRIGS